MQGGGAYTSSCCGRRSNSCTAEEILLDLLFVDFINFTLLLADFLFERRLYSLLRMADFTQMINCKFVCFNDPTAVPVLHYVFRLSVRDVHGLGSAEESSDMLERCQAHIFTPDERILQ